jgi:hypothetical protein
VILSRNMKEIFLHIIRNFKAGVAMGMEKVNSNIKTKNHRLVNKIISRLTSALI